MTEAEAFEKEPRDPSEERREWVEARRAGLFATDTPKILGLSRWGTALTVYQEKVGEAEAGDMSLPAWIGLKLEATVAEMYTQATGIRVRRDSRLLMHPSTPFPMGTHLDYRAWGRPKLLVECKTRAYMRGYGEDGSSQIPADIWAQVQHEMAVTGATECHVAVLFGHHTFRVYPIKRDQQFIDKLLPKLEQYWNEYVVPRVPPPPTGHDLDEAELRRRHPADSEPLRPATPSQEALVARLRQAELNRKQAELAEAELENQVKDLIGAAAGIQGSFGTITWKKDRDREVTDWEQVASTQSNVLEDLFLFARPTEEEELRRFARAQATAQAAVSLATYKKIGSRRFIKSWSEE